MRRKSVQPAETHFIKQRSPAGGRWAGKKADQIKKMRHCDLFIVGIATPRVKFTGVTNALASLEQERVVEIVQLLPELSDPAWIGLLRDDRVEERLKKTTVFLQRL